MGVNIFRVSALIFVGLVGAASAAPLPVTSGSGASIQGHNAYSRFLPGAYVIAPGATDDGLGTAASMLQNGSGGDASLVQTKAIVPMLPVDFTDDALSSIANRSGSDAGATQGSSGAPTEVGIVPLPPALPLFGAAVLGLAVFGWSRKRRTAKA